MVGEKSIDPDCYYDGWQNSDDQCSYIGFCYDQSRSAWDVPRCDAPGAQLDNDFGSAHLSGCNFVFGDGAVHTISYAIDSETFHRLANRDDGLPIDAKQW
jgi:hypothetical protein